VEQTKNERSQKEREEVIANCDAIIFGSYRKEEDVHTVMNFVTSKKGKHVVPFEMGHKYNILLFNRGAPKEEDIELFNAILGDPRGYVERMGRHGWHGLVVKQKAWVGKGAKEIKAVFADMLYKYGFEEKLIKKVLKTVV
jgi:hypothetical protein